MGENLHDLTPVVVTGASDLYHLRNSGGIDHSITMANLRQSLVSYTELTAAHIAPDGISEVGKIQIFKNINAAGTGTIELTLGTSGDVLNIYPKVIVKMLYNGTNWVFLDALRHDKNNEETTLWFNDNSFISRTAPVNVFEFTHPTSPLWIAKGILAGDDEVLLQGNEVADVPAFPSALEILRYTSVVQGHLRLHLTLDILDDDVFSAVSILYNKNGVTVEHDTTSITGLGQVFSYDMPVSAGDFLEIKAYQATALNTHRTSHCSVTCSLPLNPLPDGTSNRNNFFGRMVTDTTYKAVVDL